MKGFSVGAIILVLSVATVFGQSPTRVGLIHSSRFDDRTNGIKRLIQATNVALAFTTCNRCSEMRRYIKSIEKEINELKSRNQPLGDRETRLQTMKNEYLRAVELSKQDFDRKAKLVVEPVLNDIRDLIKKFAVEHGYGIIVDKYSVLFESPIPVGEEKVPDVTAEFIKFCNADFERRWPSR